MTDRKNGRRSRAALPATGADLRQGAMNIARPPVAEGVRRVWAVPVVLALVTVFGLASALLGQHGAWRSLSLIALAVPLATIVSRLWRPDPPDRSP